jgi:WD40 repeat protein
VFCIDTYQNYLATGGEDDKAYIWTYKQDENNNDNKIQIELLYECEKFQDSVTNLKFSHDGKYLAIADMSGKIRVYLNETKELFWSHDIEMDIETLDWHPICNVLFCSTSEGYFIMLKISTGDIKVMYFGDNTVLSCFRILKDGKRAVCCYNNGNVRIIDLKTAQPEFNILKAHESDILCLDISSDGNLLATAGTDMKITITNTTNGKIIVNLPVPKCEINNSDDEENSIESVGFCKTMALIACATLKGQLFVWDLNTHVLRNKLEIKNVGFSKLLWSSSQETLYVSTLNGTVNSYDGRNLVKKQTYGWHESEILDFCLNNDYLFTASNDFNVKGFKIIN